MSDERTTTEPGGASRRALLLGAGAVGAAVALSACGSDPDSDTPDGSTDPTGGTGNGTGALATTTEIPVGGGKVFATAGVVVTQPAAGTFKAFTSTCTHQNCPVANVDGGTINCNCHGSQYSITDGSVRRGPATRPLAAKNITVAGEQITLA